MNDKIVGPVHWSFWAIGAIGLVWNVLGCLNFFLQMNAEAVAGMPESYRAIVESRSAWATGAFAIAVFGGTLGSLLLLLRKPAAYYLFIASLFGAVGAQLPLLGMADFPVAALIGGLMQLAVTAFLIWYSKHAEGKGWIRREQ
ncbi:MAG: hypothetical protein O3A13_01440 [Proteobacteria bacterium]|nr:hypothetical protein [Pseudomonadota bacterium]MDA0992277.1 hypothetical protein [Pseudomonadota bacterium]